MAPPEPRSRRRLTRMAAALRLHPPPAATPPRHSSAWCAGAPSWRHLTVEPLTPNLGAVVRGLRLPDISPEAAAELRLVFQLYKVFFIHAEDGAPPLSPDDLVRFVQIFGEPNIYPRAGFEPTEGSNPHVLPVLQPEDASTVPFGGAGWHTGTHSCPAPPPLPAPSLPAPSLGPQELTGGRRGAQTPPTWPRPPSRPCSTRWRRRARGATPSSRTASRPSPHSPPGCSSSSEGCAPPTARR